MGKMVTVLNFAGAWDGQIVGRASDRIAYRAIRAREYRKRHVPMVVVLDVLTGTEYTVHAVDVHKFGSI